MARRFLVTGGAGFIGAAIVRALLKSSLNQVLVVDNLTYAGSLAGIERFLNDPRCALLRCDIADLKKMQATINEFKPDVVMHLAAESHVDRSIDSALPFVHTNVMGTVVLLEAALQYWRNLPAAAAENFRFLHVSTDEVFGSLPAEGIFSETSPYDPNSPYSASKAASDHFARAWFRTYGFPILVSNGSNTYGPYQFPEKLVPLMIAKALEGKPLPVYGRGDNIRDWIHVDDHASGLLTIVAKGTPGESYLVAGGNERRNLDVVKALCAAIDEFAPDPGVGAREKLISFVADRPGHDFRYAADTTKIRDGLGWAPHIVFDEGLRATVAWYIENQDWLWRLRDAGNYGGERLGVR